MANTAKKRKRNKGGRFVSETRSSSSLDKGASRAQNGGSAAPLSRMAEPPALDSAAAAGDIDLQSAHDQGPGTLSHESKLEAPNIVQTLVAPEQGAEPEHRNGVSRDGTLVEEIMQIPSFRARVIARLIKKLG